MQLVRRFRLPALFCALAVLFCELISRPYAEMGISDDGPYILMARHLARTGHIVFNGWAAPLLGWQLYLGAAFIKLFGFSYTNVRMSTLLVAVVTAWLLQRTLVLAGVNERNATLGTLAFVLSPLYLMLSVTYMSDIFGLFAVVICLYGCLRALRASTERAAIAWLCFAVATNAIFGTARQIAWLGILVMVPSTLFVIGWPGTPDWRAALRERRRVLLAGCAATVAGAVFIFACMQWLGRQPWIQPEHLIPNTFPIGRTWREVGEFLMDAPFLLLAMVALFLPQIRRASRRAGTVAFLVSLAYTLRILYAVCRPGRAVSHLLEPTHQSLGNWVGIHGIHEGIHLLGDMPIFLHPWMQWVVTFVSLGGVLGLIISALPSTRRMPIRKAADTNPRVSWRQLGVLLGPFALVYTLLLVPRASIGWVFDRYLLELLVVALLCLVRYYQERVSPQLPRSALLLVGLTAVYGVACTHNMCALYRARVTLAAEIQASGVPDTSVDYGFEYNFGTELQHSDHLRSL